MSQPPAEPVALHPTDIYDFAGWLTTRKTTIAVGSSQEAGPMADAVDEYLRKFPEKFAVPVPAVLPDCTEDDARGLRLVGPHGGVMSDMPNPTDAELASPLFEAIWQATKTWDVNVPEYYKGYCGMNGSHVVMILRAIAAAPPPVWVRPVAVGLSVAQGEIHG